MNLYFQTPPLNPGRTAAGFPFQESSNLRALQSQPAAQNSGECAHQTRWESREPTGQQWVGVPPRTFNGTPIRTGT